MGPDNVRRADVVAVPPGMDEVKAAKKPQRITQEFLRRVFPVVSGIDHPCPERGSMMIAVGKFLVQADLCPALPVVLPFLCIESVSEMHIGIDGWHRNVMIFGYRT